MTRWGSVERSSGVEAQGLDPGPAVAHCGSRGAGLPLPASFGKVNFVLGESSLAQRDRDKFPSARKAQNHSRHNHSHNTATLVPVFVIFCFLQPPWKAVLLFEVQRGAVTCQEPCSLQVSLQSQ